MKHSDASTPEDEMASHAQRAPAPAAEGRPLRVRWWVLRDDARKWRDERLPHFFARHLPRAVKRWVVVHVAAMVWQENVEPDKITYPLMCKALEGRARGRGGRV